jgi:hypothetical protein
MRSFLVSLFALPLISALAVNNGDVDTPARGPALERRAQPVCGSHGYSTGTDSYFYKSSASLATLSACGAYCVADRKCLSFAIGDGACQTFSVAV